MVSESSVRVCELDGKGFSLDAGFSHILQLTVKLSNL